MDKKYQVFVSSTYMDLVDERKVVIQSLLESDCIPTGMELFPASDDEKWAFIQKVIDGCDYYVLIMGGKYGSMSDDGISYTQMEYEYAVSRGIPILAFLHRNPEDLPPDKRESDTDLKLKLLQFRKSVEGKMCKFWHSQEQLRSEVIVSINSLKKSHRAIGWVKADNLPSEDVLNSLVSLQKENDELKIEYAKVKELIPQDTADLAQGEDPISISVIAPDKDDDDFDPDYRNIQSMKTTWNEILIILGHAIFKSKIGYSTYSIGKVIAEYFLSQSQVSWTKEWGSSADISRAIISEDDARKIIFQFKALGMLSSRETDGRFICMLTPYGEQCFTRQVALRKTV